MKLKYKYIDNLTDLEKIIKDIEKETCIAVDLEADSMYHFKEKICLIQFSINETNFIVDPLKLEDLSLLKPIFSNQKIKKIFHGADYDVRSLYRDFNIEINFLFDTQLACRFLGFNKTGLEAVLESKFNIKLSKKYQKKNWSIRPLPEQMIEYAAKDVLYLISLSQWIEDELVKKERLSWVQEECKILSQVRPALNDGTPLYIKFKGTNGLSPKSLAVLESLLNFRKKVAENKDKPLFKILDNDIILKLARLKPLKLNVLKELGLLSDLQFKRYGESIIGIINDGINTPKEKLPLLPKTKAPFLPSFVPERISVLKDFRDAKAQQLYIEPSLILSKGAINAIALKMPDEIEKFNGIKEMRNWQKQAFSNEIILLLKKIR